MGQNTLHYCQYMTEHVTFLSVYDRTRYIIVSIWQNTLHYCQDGTEHVALLSVYDRTRYVFVSI